MAVLAAGKAARSGRAAARRHDRGRCTGDRDSRPTAADPAVCGAADAGRGRDARTRDATATTPPGSGAAALSEREGELSAADIKRLRGVASWAGDTLKLTVYNGTSWRVTELHLKISRFKDDDFVEDEHPILLLPPGAAVDSGVADLLLKVAPDRKKPGLNPADTGPFEGKAGQQPENFRWEIDAARGYARK